MRGQNTDTEMYNDLIHKAIRELDVYDQILSKQKYLAGGVSCIAVECYSAFSCLTLGHYLG